MVGKLNRASAQSFSTAILSIKLVDGSGSGVHRKMVYLCASYSLREGHLKVQKHVEQRSVYVFNVSSFGFFSDHVNVPAQGINQRFKGGWHGKAAGTVFQAIQTCEEVL